MKEAFLVAQLTHATGCSVEQAYQLLIRHTWNLEAAISAWFMHSQIPGANQSSAQEIFTSRQSHCPCPCNTPTTPPYMSETSFAFERLGT